MIITSCNSGVVFTDLLLPDLYALCPQIPRPCSHRLAILSLVVTSVFFWDWRHVFTDLLFFLLSWHLFFLKCSRRVQMSCIWSMHSHCCLLSFTLAHNTWCLALVCVFFVQFSSLASRKRSKYSAPCIENIVHKTCWAHWYLRYWYFLFSTPCVHRLEILLIFASLRDCSHGGVCISCSLRLVFTDWKYCSSTHPFVIAHSEGFVL